MPPEIEDEVIEAEEQDEVAPEDETEGEETEAEEPAAEGEPEPEEVEITIGDDKPPEPEKAAPDWVKDLRKRNKELAKRNAELEAQTRAAPAEKSIVLGEKPTLAGCDYDADAYESKLDAWKERKRQIEDAEARKADGERKAQEAWQQTVQTYDKAKAALKVKDFSEAEEATREALSVVQQGIILQGAKDVSAALVYAIGKNPTRLAKLAAIQDPVEFAVAIGEAKALMKTTPKKTIPKPEATVRGGSVATTAATSGKIDALLAKAQKTGDYTEYFKAKKAAKK